MTYMLPPQYQKLLEGQNKAFNALLTVLGNQDLRNQDLLESILNQASHLKRQEMLQHANADQINAVSEMVSNVLKKRISVQPACHDT